jgi:DNA-binding transcriptional regulator/RsmH inhibitor MraZ
MHNLYCAGCRSAQIRLHIEHSRAIFDHSRVAKSDAKHGRLIIPDHLERLAHLTERDVMVAHLPRRFQ